MAGCCRLNRGWSIDACPCTPLPPPHCALQAESTSQIAAMQARLDAMTLPRTVSVPVSACTRPFLTPTHPSLPLPLQPGACVVEDDGGGSEGQDVPALVVLPVHVPHGSPPLAVEAMPQVGLGEIAQSILDYTSAAAQDRASEVAEMARRHAAERDAWVKINHANEASIKDWADRFEKLMQKCRDTIAADEAKQEALDAARAHLVSALNDVADLEDVRDALTGCAVQQTAKVVQLENRICSLLADAQMLLLQQQPGLRGGVDGGGGGVASSAAAAASAAAAPPPSMPCRSRHRAGSSHSSRSGGSNTSRTARVEEHKWPPALHAVLQQTQAQAQSAALDVGDSDDAEAATEIACSAVL